MTGGVPSRGLVPHSAVADGVGMEAEAERHREMPLELRVSTGEGGMVGVELVEGVRAAVHFQEGAGSQERRPMVLELGSAF